MSWPLPSKEKAEVGWFWETADRVAVQHGGSLISGRRTPAHNSAVGGHVNSLHMSNLAGDYEFDTVEGFERAWSLGRSLGLHGYKKPEPLVIHWQARPRKTVDREQGGNT